MILLGPRSLSRLYLDLLGRLLGPLFIPKCWCPVTLSVLSRCHLCVLSFSVTPASSPVLTTQQWGPQPALNS